MTDGIDKNQGRRDAGLRIRRVLETCLYARDLEAAQRFYSEVLGLPVHSENNGRDVFLRCGDGMLLIFDPRKTSPPDPDIPSHGADGPGHVAFAVPEEDLDAWRERLIRLGVAIEKEIDWPGGGRSFYFRDPAGNCLELATPSLWGL